MGSFGSLSWYANVREGSGEGLNLVVVVAITAIVYTECHSKRKGVEG